MIVLRWSSRGSRVRRVAAAGSCPTEEKGMYLHHHLNSLISEVPPRKTERGKRLRAPMLILVAIQIHKIRRRLRNQRRSRPRVAPNLERLEIRAKMTGLVEETAMVMRKRKRRR